MFGEKIEKRTLPVVVYTTSGHKIEGNVYFHANVRLIDEMNQPERQYLAVSSATVTSTLNEVSKQHEFIILNKREIVCIAPLDG